MNSPRHLDVTPAVVIDAGRRTVTTAEQWRTWGQRARIRFEVTRPDLASTQVSNALTEYAGRWCPQLLAVSAEVAALGDLTATAAVVVDDADVDAAAALAPSSSAVAETGSYLRRPINSERVVV